MRLEARDILLNYGEGLGVEARELRFEDRALTGLIGPNGAGKSTLLRILSRSLKPQRGVVLLDGQVLHRLPSRQVARKLAFVGHNLDGLLDLTVEELVQRGRFPHQTLLSSNPHEDRVSVEWALDAMRLGALRRRSLGHLSHGELRRAWTAVALAQRPDILLLDEPTAFLDIAHQLELLALLSELKGHGVTVVMSMHDLLLTSLYCERVVALRAGHVACHGPTDEVLTPELVREVFGVEVRCQEDPATGRPALVPYALTRMQPAPSANGAGNDHIRDALPGNTGDPSPH